MLQLFSFFAFYICKIKTDLSLTFDQAATDTAVMLQSALPCVYAYICVCARTHTHVPGVDLS